MAKLLVSVNSLRPMKATMVSARVGGCWDPAWPRNVRLFVFDSHWPQSLACLLLRLAVCVVVCPFVTQEFGVECTVPEEGCTWIRHWRYREFHRLHHS
jgi:hypothetical protein